MANKLSMSHARVLSKIEDNEKIIEIADKIIVDGLSVREVEELSHSGNIEKKNTQVRHDTNRNEYKVIEEELAEKFGTRVKIKNNRIELHFVNPNDLNRILEIIGLDN
jgi:ParB family chromosome partitioning protein